MPLKRTPPSRTSDADLDYIASSLPNLDLTNTQKNLNLAPLKRKHGDSEMQDFMEEMREMFSKFVSEQNSKLQAVQDSISEIKIQNNSIQCFIDMISKKFDDIQKEVNTLKDERKDNLIYIKLLEGKVESIEKHNCSSKIEIRNIPTISNENKEALIGVVKSLGDLLDLELQTSDIRDIHRGFAKPENTRPIVVEFSSVLVKEKFINSSKKYKTTKKCQLNTTSLKIKGTEKPIYVSECLTTNARRLFFLSRDFAKTFNYTYCWTSYGKIYMRKKEGSPLIRINNEADLNRMKTTENI